MPEGKVFLDTNVLVYAYDISAGKKHEIARNIVIDLWNSRFGVLSTQVIQEFFVTITTRISKPMGKKIAKNVINDLKNWDIVINDNESILQAVEMHLQHKYSFWDSLIIQASVNGGAASLLSEDLSDGQIIDGVKIENPFG